MKRYLSQDQYFKNRFGIKVAKVSLNGGFTCPNRDGTKGYGGCIYCSPSASGDFAGDCEKSILEQFEDITEKINMKWKNVKYMPYFQAGTGTYAPISVLREKYEQALSLPDSVGLSIATRPDCISDELIEYLCDINKRTYLVVELGLQSIHDKTGVLINRQTSYKEFEECYFKLSERGISVCIHLINGLPEETYDMMLESVKKVAVLKPHWIKFHLLHILKNTVAEKLYLQGKIKCMEQQEYINLLCDQIEYLHPDTVVARLTGDGSRESLIAPLWSIYKFNVFNGVDKELKKRNSHQGIYFKDLIENVD